MFSELAVQAAMSCSVFSLSKYGLLSARLCLANVGVSGTGESAPTLGKNQFDFVLPNK